MPNENEITISCDGKVILSITKETKEKLKQFKPSGYSGYTMLDLLQDWIKVYSWQLEKCAVYSLIGFIKKIRGGKIEAYRKGMLYLLEIAC